MRTSPRFIFGLLALASLVSCDKKESASAPASAPSTAPAPARPAASDWPAFHGGGTLTGVADALPGGPELKLRWTYTTSDANSAGVEGGAAVVGDTVYVGDADGTLHAIDLATGKRRW